MVSIWAVTPRILRLTDNSQPLTRLFWVVSSKTVPLEGPHLNCPVITVGQANEAGKRLFCNAAREIVRRGRLATARQWIAGASVNDKVRTIALQPTD